MRSPELLTTAPAPDQALALIEACLLAHGRSMPREVQLLRAALSELGGHGAGEPSPGGARRDEPTALAAAGAEEPELPAIDLVLEDPATSFWLRNAARGALQRDPVDAARDAAMLHRLLERRCGEALRAASTSPPSVETLRQRGLL